MGATPATTFKLDGIRRVADGESMTVRGILRLSLRKRPATKLIDSASGQVWLRLNETVRVAGRSFRSAN